MTVSLKSFFEHADIQQNIKQIIRPIGYLLYDQFYPYIWFICLYNVVLIFLVVVILFLLIGGNPGWGKPSFLPVGNNPHP